VVAKSLKHLTTCFRVTNLSLFGIIILLFGYVYGLLSNVVEAHAWQFNDFSHNIKSFLTLKSTPSGLKCKKRNNNNNNVCVCVYIYIYIMCNQLHFKYIKKLIYLSNNVYIYKWILYSKLKEVII
jgi:hypothetical protein